MKILGLMGLVVVILAGCSAPTDAGTKEPPKPAPEAAKQSPVSPQ